MAEKLLFLARLIAQAAPSFLMPLASGIRMKVKARMHQTELKVRRENAFERISTIACTIGRYPIPRRADETRPRQF